MAFLTDWAGRFPLDRFTLAGHGLETSPIEDPLVPQVESVPHFRRDQLPELLRVHDAGLMTSRVEGWGLVLNEMLESGLTVFATDSGATRDLQPYFPSTLRPFPPKPGWQPGAWDEERLQAYYEVFNWERIGREYLAELAAARR